MYNIGIQEKCFLFNFVLPYSWELNVLNLKSSSLYNH